MSEFACLPVNISPGKLAGRESNGNIRPSDILKLKQFSVHSYKITGHLGLHV